MLALGMYIGTRQTAKEVRRELMSVIEKSETAQILKEILTDQTLIEKATRFFEEATVLVSSEEAKNFFKNVTALMKELSGSHGYGNERNELKKARVLRLPKREKS